MDFPGIATMLQYGFKTARVGQHMLTDGINRRKPNRTLAALCILAWHSEFEFLPALFLVQYPSIILGS